jgi:hypothetical protein
VAALTDTTTYPGTTVTMTNGDIIGVVLNDGTIGWTTISACGLVADHARGGLASAANAGNFVYWFTIAGAALPGSRVREPAHIRHVDVRQGDGYAALHLPRRAELRGDAGEDWRRRSSSILVEPLRLNTAITLNSEPTDVSKVVNMTVLYPAEDYDATSNDIAFPQEWFAALEWELTLRCLPLFPQEWTPAMEKNYQNATAIARELNLRKHREMHFQPGMRLVARSPTSRMS